MIYTVKRLKKKLHREKKRAYDHDRDFMKIMDLEFFSSSSQARSLFHKNSERHR